MTRYRLTWTETLTAVVETDSEDAAREIWMERPDDLDEQATDNRHDYDLTIEEEP